MQTAPHPVEECVSALATAFPIEDIWLLERDAANECALDGEHNLIIVVPGSQNVAHTEAAVREVLRHQFKNSGIEAYVFPLSAVERIPRPLLVKMALTSGERIYCR